MSNDVDPLALAKLPSIARMAQSQSAGLGRRDVLKRIPPLRLVVAGPMSAGKTTLVHALVGPRLRDLGEAQAQLTGRTEVVTEYRHVDRVRLMPHNGRVRVELPSAQLDQWNVSVVDTPPLDSMSTTADFDLFGLVYEADSTAVIYVIPDRGMTDIDERVLRSLGPTPLMVVHNLREFDTTTRYDEIQPIRVAALSGPSSVPVALPLALGRLRHTTPEWELLSQAVAFLRQMTVSEAELIACQRHADQHRQDLREEYADRLRALREKRLGTRLESLQLVADMVAVEQDGPQASRLDSLLGEVTRLVLAMPTRPQAGDLIQQRTEEQRREYHVELTQRGRANVDRFSLGSAGREPDVQDTIFSKALRDLRDALMGAIGNIAADDALCCTEVERSRLNAIADEVESQRFELLVVGQFSAGKSSLLNALLGVEPGREFLPTKVTPTTTTLNYIVHGSEASAEPEWAESLPNLALLRADNLDGMPCYRVWVDELHALATWLRTGEVRFEDCAFRMRSGQELRGREAEEGLRLLMSAARIGGESPINYLYEADNRGLSRGAVLPAGDVPVGVAIESFADRPKTAKNPGSLWETIDSISESPAVALRAKRLVIHHPNELLRFVTLVDTPGTDAPRPGHKETTRSAVVGDKKRAVIYCFAGDKAGSEDDRSNIEMLQSCNVGADEVSRFFFIITKKGMHRPADVKDIRSRIRQTLNTLGIHSDRIYFTEVIDEHNDEFQQLANDLSTFSRDNQRPLLIAYARSVTNVVAEIGRRSRDTIRSAEQSEEERLAWLEHLTVERGQLENVRQSFRSNSDWGLPSVYEAGNIGNLAEARDVDEDIGGLIDKAAFSRTGELINNIEKANEILERQLRNSWDGSMGKLRSEIAKIGKRSLDTPELNLPGELFSESRLRQAVADVSWRGLLKRVWARLDQGTKMDADFAANRGRISDAWRYSKGDAKRKIDQEIERVGELVDGELDRLVASVDAQIKIASTPPDQTVVEAAKVAVDRVSAWLVGLDALIDKMEDALS